MTMITNFQPVQVTGFKITQKERTFEKGGGALAFTDNCRQAVIVKEKLKWHQLVNTKQKKANFTGYKYMPEKAPMVKIKLSPAVDLRRYVKLKKLQIKSLLK